jgi:hypothetical protein
LILQRPNVVNGIYRKQPDVALDATGVAIHP